MVEAGYLLEVIVVLLAGSILDGGEAAGLRDS